MAGVKGRSGRKLSVRGALRMLEKKVDVNINEIVDGLIQKASEGSAESARILFEYRFGKPKQQIDLDINVPNMEQVALLYRSTLAAAEDEYKQLTEGNES